MYVTWSGADQVVLLFLVGKVSEVGNLFQVNFLEKCGACRNYKCKAKCYRNTSSVAVTLDEVNSYLYSEYVSLSVPYLMQGIQIQCCATLDKCYRNTSTGPEKSGHTI